MWIFYTENKQTGQLYEKWYEPEIYQLEGELNTRKTLTSTNDTQNNSEFKIEFLFMGNYNATSCRFWANCVL